MEALPAYGKLKLHLVLGAIQITPIFTVVENLHPNIILGIRQMKSDNIKIDPRNDCINMNGEIIPFLKYISAPSTIYQGNYRTQLMQ